MSSSRDELTSRDRKFHLNSPHWDKRPINWRRGRDELGPRAGSVCYGRDGFHLRFLRWIPLYERFLLFLDNSSRFSCKWALKPGFHERRKDRRRNKCQSRSSSFTVKVALTQEQMKQAQAEASELFLALVLVLTSTFFSWKASSSTCILRVCKFCGFSAKELDIIFNSLLTSLFMFGAEVWGCAAHSKYLVQIDRLLNRAFRSGYVQKGINFGFWILSTIETYCSGTKLHLEDQMD